MPIRRRSLFLSSAALFAAACARVTPPSAPPTPLPLTEGDRWTQEAQSILSDVLQSLRTFDDFQAFRVSTAAESSTRLAAELTWDAPSSAAWDEATHVSRGVHGRADQLFRMVTTTRLDPSVWRTQRALADATHDLLDLSDSLSAYRDRVDALPPGDASGALPLLKTAWERWDSAAARWGVSHVETLGCGSSS